MPRVRMRSEVSHVYVQWRSQGVAKWANAPPPFSGSLLYSAQLTEVSV